ncbi:MAG: LTA synthase family protein [Bacteroidales bacterium]|nr:LTA synthase family protein [Bacteroidales bacterium]
MKWSLSKNGIKDGFARWAELSVWLLLCMLIVRLIFFFQVHYRIEVERAQFINVLRGVVYDFYVVCHATAWLLLPFMLLYLCFPKATVKVSRGLVYAYVVVAALLTEYYCNLNMPLDHVVLVYTPEEVLGTASSSAHVTLAPILWFLVTMALVILLGWLWKKVRFGLVIALGVIVAGLTVALLVPVKEYIREEKYYDDHTAFCLGVNQPAYSYVKITDYMHNAEVDFMEEDVVSDVVLEAAAAYQASHPQQHFLDKEYPLFRVFDDPDVLGSFLEPTDDGLPPDFVFIIVEGFGQRLTGVDFPKMSFTPYIDSLKREGLYWKNCFSTSARTFGVLPAIFASAPHGKYGFCVTDRPMPDHNSLLKDLKRNGYSSSYYYGGVHAFDRFDGFLKNNKLDFIYLPEITVDDSATYRMLREYHRWGLDDHETFAFAMNRKTAEPSPRRNVDIFMTLTTHEPFLCDNMEMYEKRVEEMLKSRRDVTETERTNILKNLNIFGCYLYMDDCVRELMRYYQSLPQFKNTVFVITGDHRMGFLVFGSPVHNYNVPLLIYSPLVKQPRSMDAVVSHLDITPTINAYLRDNYDYTIDTNCHWLGTSLDTATAFGNTRKLSFMLNNRDVVDYISENYMLSNGRLVRFDENMKATLVDDGEKLQRMKTELQDFQVVSQYVVQHNKLNRVDGLLEVLRSDETDFESSYSSIFKNHVDKENGNHFALLDSTDKYASFFDALKMYADHENVYVELTFDLRSLDTTRVLPKLAVEMGPYYYTLELETMEGKSLNTGQWEHYWNKLSIPVKDSCKGNYLKMYLNNFKRTTMAYDNITVRVTAR